MNSPKAMSGINWQWMLTRSLLALLALTGFGAILLSFGFVDPPRSSHYEYRLAEFTPDSYGYPLPQPEFTVELVATIPLDADANREWGIWLKDNDDQWTIIAINGGQYITARQCPTEFSGNLLDCTPFTATQPPTYWRRFHHIKPNGQTNHLRVNFLKDDGVQGLGVWVNGEWVYAVPFTPANSFSRWGRWQPNPIGLGWDVKQSKVWGNEPTN